MEDKAYFNNQTCYRLIPSKFPPINLFEDVADTEEFEDLYAVQLLTNPRLQEQLGKIDLIPKGERVFGFPGSSFVMAAFTHLNPDGSRFSNGDFGVYYGAAQLKDAIEETKYHRARFMSYTNEPAQEIDMRCLVAIFTATLVDIRAPKFLLTSYYDKDNYSDSQKLGLQCKLKGLDGITYTSVRGTGDCYALLKPSLISKCHQASHFGYIWDGNSIVTIYKKELSFKTP